MLSAWLGQSTWPSTQKPLLSCWRLEPVSGTFICLIMVEGTSPTKKTEHFKVKIRPPCKKQHRIAVNPLATRELKFSTGRTHSTWCLCHGNQTESTTFCSVLCFNWQRRSWEPPRNGFGDLLHWECTDLFLMKAASTWPWANRDISAPVPRWLQSIFKIKRLQIRFDKTVSVTVSLQRRNVCS